MPIGLEPPFFRMASKRHIKRLTLRFTTLGLDIPPANEPAYELAFDPHEAFECCMNSLYSKCLVE